MRRFFWIRLWLFLRQSRWAFYVVGTWVVFGTFAFHRWERAPLREALLDALYLGPHRGSFWDLYTFWGQCVLFGIVVSVFGLQALQHYNPQEGSRMLAREMKNHTIIIGYTHLGARLIEQCQRNARPYVLIEKEASLVDDLVRAGEPVIIDNAKEADTLEQAGIAHACLVVVASNNIETALLVTKRARERNPQARIIVRCYQDDFAEILESLGATQVISSSKSALEEIAPHLNLSP